MKKSIKVIILSVSVVVCTLVYVKYHSGLGFNFYRKNLPYNIRLNSDNKSSAPLLDEDGFELIGKGFQFYGSSFTINDILAYGYNDSSVIVKCTDSLDNIKYLSSYETKYKNSKGNPEISFRDISEEYVKQIKKNYNWIELDE